MNSKKAWYYKSATFPKSGHEKPPETADFTVSGGLRPMRITGLEPARRRHQILSLARLPIPPYPPIS